MRTVYRSGSIEIIEMAACVAAGFPPCSEFYVYHGDKLIRVCPSIGMARDRDCVAEDDLEARISANEDRAWRAAKAARLLA